jgi:type IV fimbrial biogenesis protein FimT
LNRQNNLRHGNRRHGFTVVEIVVAIATTLSVMLLGQPILDLLTDRSPKYLLQELSLASHLEYARQEAVRLQASVTICPSQDGRNCLVNGDWSQGWIIFTDDASPPRHFSVGDRLLHREQGEVGQQPVVASMDVIQYQADGSILLN